MHWKEKQRDAKNGNKISALGLKRGASSVLFFSYCQGNSTWYNYPRIDVGPGKIRSVVYVGAQRSLQKVSWMRCLASIHLLQKVDGKFREKDVYNLLFHSWTNDNNILGKDFNLFFHAHGRAPRAKCLEDVQL